jgi:ethanolamine-phosphate phospho-lyase
MKARRVLLTTDGPLDNIIKIKPPIVFSEANVDHMIRELRELLAEELPQADLAVLLEPAQPGAH